MTRRVARRIAGLVTSMALALGCAGPAPTATSPAPTATQTATATPQSAPPEIGIFGQPVDAGCAIDTAWGAGPGVTVLPRLPDCAQPVSRWQSLSAGGTLATDSCGEAWLNTSCGRIYLFQDGRLQTSLCNRATAVQNGYCQLENSSAWQSTCSGQVQITTPDAALRLEGTWASTTYLPDSSVSLFAVFEGSGTATANAASGGTLPAQEIGTGEFWFSVPDGRPAPIDDVPARTAQPIDRLPAVARRLGLESWFATIVAMAANDGVTSLPEMPVINLRAAGGRLSEPRIWDALLLTMAWDEQVKVSFPEGDGSIFALNGKAPPRDLRVQARNFKRASDLIHELAPDRFPVTVIAERTRGDDDLVARWVAQLRELSFRPVTVEATDAEDGAKLFAKLVGAETATIWIAGH